MTQDSSKKSGIFAWFGGKKPTDAQQTQDSAENPTNLDDQIPVEAQDLADNPQKEASQGLFSRLKQGLAKTRAGFTAGLADLLLGEKEINEDLLEEVETLLLMADLGVETTEQIINELTERSARKELKNSEALLEKLKSLLLETAASVEQPLEIPKQDTPFVILMVGVNGVGKTTTIGKLAHQFIDQGQSVMLAAGDTFRAAAVEQLKTWGERNQVPVVAQHTGADSASVIYDALEKARAKNIDILIADTAGRLHNKGNLMDELSKISRIMGKIDPQAPHEVMLVVDAGTGQNALVQAVEFDKVVKLTGVTISKLDGTAKGGVVFALADKLKLPIRYIGVGEAKQDLRPFNAKDYVDALFEG